jgi:hypothetical protein
MAVVAEGVDQRVAAVVRVTATTVEHEVHWTWVVAASYAVSYLKHRPVRYSFARELHRIRGQIVLVFDDHQIRYSYLKKKTKNWIGGNKKSIVTLFYEFLYIVSKNKNYYQ